MVSPSSHQSRKFEEVYYVEPGPGAVMNPIAIRPEIQDDLIMWYDTSRGKSLMVSQIRIEPENVGDSTPEKIVIKTKDGFQVILKKLDLDTYNTCVKNRTIGQKSFQSSQEIHDYYLNTNFELY